MPKWPGHCQSERCGDAGPSFDYPRNCGRGGLKHSYIIFCIFMSVTVMTASLYFHFRILKEWMLLSHSLPSSVYKFVCVHYQFLIKLHTSILEPSTEHWYFLNILIIMGMRIYQLGMLACQWHFLQDPKIHYNLIQVLAIISSCITWTNSVPLLKIPRYFYHCIKQLFEMNYKKIVFRKATPLCNCMDTLTAATAISNLYGYLSYQWCIWAHQIRPSSL